MHLKEYSAEIESLRSQLQATREKNGVYLDPKDFYDMENKIASLTMQLAECESVLKSRNEETSLLRESNEHMDMKIQHLSVALDTTNNELSTTKSELENTKLQLEDTVVELKATEAVVMEQLKTEQRLTSEAVDLQGEVKDCRGKIHSLHDKIGLYAAGEAAGETRTLSFVANLLAARSSLLNSVEELGSKSRESSVLIQTEIQDLLSAGRSTCQDLKVSVDRALEVLLGDADASKHALERDLCEISDQLTIGRDHVLFQLSNIKAEMNTTMDRINELTQQSKALHETQQLNVATMVESMHADVQRLISSTHSFVLSQEEVLAQQIQQSNASSQSLKERLGSYCNVFTSQQLEQETWLQLQSDKIQKVCQWNIHSIYFVNYGL